jgi:FtsP/CotA-like multicopper oxidase with cupredoxin domain
MKISFDSSERKMDGNKTTSKGDRMAVKTSKGIIPYIVWVIAIVCGLLFTEHRAQAATREFNMTIEEVTIRVAPDLTFKTFAFNGQVPGPLIHVREGDAVVVHVTNNTSLPHTIHWHGVDQINNWKNDGVPEITQEAIQPGDTFTYRWKAERSGTLWYHCHVNVNEHVAMRGMWGPIIIDAKHPRPISRKVTKNVIAMYSSWESPYAHQYGRGGGPHDEPDYWSVNGKSFPLDMPVRVKKGDIVRFRFIGAGDDFHQIHLHGHDMLIVSKDGYPLRHPYYVDTVPLGPGERYDAIVRMNNPGRFVMHDHIDKHMTNGGKEMGGPMTVIEYDGIPKESWYAWKDKDQSYDPDFFYSESMKKGYGLFENPRFKGESPEEEHHHHGQETH